VFVFSVLLNVSRWIEANDSDLRLDVINLEEAFSNGAWFLQFSHDSHGTGLLRYRYYMIYFHGLAWNIIMFVIPIGLLTFFNVKIWRKVKKIKSNYINLNLIKPRTNTLINILTQVTSNIINYNSIYSSKNPQKPYVALGRIPSKNSHH